MKLAGPAAGLFDTMVKVDPWSGKITPFADFAAYETANNPDKGAIDSDSYGLAERHGGFVVADAAGNDVLGVDFHKHISTLAVFPDVQVDAPPFLGLPRGEDPDAGSPDDRRRAPEGSERLRRPADRVPVPARRGERVGHQAGRHDVRVRHGLHEHRGHRVGPEGLALRARDHEERACSPVTRPARSSASGRTAPRRPSPARVS